MKKINIKRHIPTILFVTGCVGTVASVIFSAHDTIKAEKVLSEANIEKYDVTPEYEELAPGVTSMTGVSKTVRKEYYPQVIKATWKCYIPTGICLVSTLTCLIVSKKLTAKQMAAIGTAVAGAGSLVSKYREEIRDAFGEDALHDIDRKIAEDEITKAKPPVMDTCGLMSCESVELSDTSEFIFFDPFTKVKFVSTKLAVLGAKYYLNRNYAIGGNVPLEMFYDFLGVALPEEYRYCQWDVEEMSDMGYYWIDIDIVKSSKPDPETGKLYYILEYEFIPGDVDENYYPFGNPLENEGRFV